MSEIIIRLVDKFPEPEFTQLQNQVFKNNQMHSAALAAALVAEAADPTLAPAPPISTYTPMVRLGAYEGDQLVGWSNGWLERGRIFYMANSGVIESHRKRGIYTMLLDAVSAHARASGALSLRSQHFVLNNPIIILKLRYGFHISGLSHSAQLGAFVELSYQFSAARLEIVRQRTVPIIPTPA